MKVILIIFRFNRCFIFMIYFKHFIMNVFSVSIPSSVLSQCLLVLKFPCWLSLPGGSEIGSYVGCT